MRKSIRHALTGIVVATMPGALSADQGASSLTDKAADAASTVANKTEQVYDETTQWLSLKRDEYQAAVSRKLTELDADLERLAARMETKAEDGKDEFKQAMADLNEKRRAAGERFEELQAASADAWEEFKQDVNESIKSLSDAFDETDSRFGSES